MKPKSCPFCGGEAGLFQTMDNRAWVVQCKECGIGTLYHWNKRSVINEWNRRDRVNVNIKMPKKITDATYTDDNTSELDYATGWNDCIDAIIESKIKGER